ncbi:MAG: dUTP diphosphatase [Patescibacteria group bacterium]|nr:dUTP diphosphatase [Patescibacteria group bacterium]
MKVKIYRCNKSALLPVYQTKGAVGFDFFVLETFSIKPSEIKLIPTGLVIKIPVNYALMIVARSSMPLKKGLDIANGVGIIDQDYCGPDDEIKLQIRNFSNKIITVEKGERLAQGIFVRADTAEFIEIKSINKQSRNGFGSTGK